MRAQLTPEDCGLMFLTLHSPLDVARYAERAENEGFGSIWLAEVPHWFRVFGGEARAAPSTAALVAARTTRMRVGIGVVSPYLRHPAVLAAEALALTEISAGR